MDKHIIICADDFAQNEDISEGVLSLMRMQRINATSCMVNSGCWRDMSEALHALKSTHFIGLHLNLTQGQPLSAMWRKHEGEMFPSLKHLLKRCYLNQLREDVVAAEIQAQLDVFTHSMHLYPDFIDGHQHIQQFPVIRRALMLVHGQQMGHVELESKSQENIPLESIDDTLSHEATFFRNTYNGWQDYLQMTGFPKPQLLALLGGMRFKHLLKQAYIPTNNRFYGVYHFKRAQRYRHYFQRFLKDIHDGGVIMCHPGNVSQDTTDPLHAYRSHELDYFMSGTFLSDLEASGVCLMKKPETAC